MQRAEHLALARAEQRVAGLQHELAALRRRQSELPDAGAAVARAARLALAQAVLTALTSGLLLAAPAQVWPAGDYVISGDVLSSVTAARLLGAVALAHTLLSHLLGCSAVPPERDSRDARPAVKREPAAERELTAEREREPEPECEPAPERELAEREPAPESGASAPVACSALEAGCIAKLRLALADVAGNKELCRGFDLSDAVLLRFSRARKLDLRAAEAMFRAALAWRAARDPRAVYERLERGPKPAIFDYTTGGWLPGLDREGAVVFVDRLGSIDVQGLVQRVEPRHLEDLIIWRQETNQRRLAAAERASGCPQFQVLVIQDLRGLGMAHMSKQGLALVKAAAAIDDSYYPESLKQCVIVNAPAAFSMVWSVCKHFFDASTRDKVQIHSGPATAELLKLVRKQDLPKFLGGDLVVDGDAHCRSIIKPGGTVPASLPRLE
jgi:hypothetical protein